MKLKLLLTVLLLITLKGFSQAEAYPVPDILQCGNEVFDLTVNTPIALGNQNPDEYSVEYFQTIEDAEDNINPIANTTAYVPQWMEEFIYVRVTNNSNGDYDIDSFLISWQSPVLDFFEDITACGSFELWGIEPYWSYYTGPGATGTQLQAGDVITQTTTIYVYQAEPCVAEGNFIVTIIDGLEATQPTPLVVCDEDGDGTATFDLTSKIPEILGNLTNTFITFHETQADAEAGTNAIPNAQSYTNIVTGPSIIYVRVESNIFNCFDVVELPLQFGGCTDNDLFGTIAYDLDNNGCGTDDLTAAGIPVTYTVGNYAATTFTNTNGEYAFYNLPDGTGTVSVQQNNLFTASPASQEVTFPGNESEYNFCYTAVNPVNDVGVVIVPVTAAQTGFDAYYNVYYYNNGTSAASGTISLQFDDANLTYVSSTPSMAVSGNTLTLSYSNLMPFQSDYASVIFNVSGPNGVTMGGTQLNFTATIDPLSGDVYPNDNTDLFIQYVVNSWDPNDITVHEGETITPEQADEYLHYTIRFQNEGNANAVNIVIENPLDANLDISTLEPIGASHAYTTTVQDGEVKFTFNDINLTWADNDEMGSMGYVTYRIKPIPGLEVNDSMQGGSTGIYFDFNPAIWTNTVTTTIESTMDVTDFASKGIVMYPNPASDIVTLHLNGMAENNVDIAITNVLGKTVLSSKPAISNSAAVIDVSSLQNGVYFVTLTSEGKSSTGKLVIK